MRKLILNIIPLTLKCKVMQQLHQQLDALYCPLVLSCQWKGWVPGVSVSGVWYTPLHMDMMCYIPAVWLMFIHPPVKDGVQLFIRFRMKPLHLLAVRLVYLMYYCDSLIIFLFFSPSIINWNGEPHGQLQNRDPRKWRVSTRVPCKKLQARCENCLVQRSSGAEIGYDVNNFTLF